MDLAVDGDTLNVAVKLTSPGAWQGGGTVFPVHLIAVDRAALPAGPVWLAFLDAEALGRAEAEPAFAVTLDPVDPALDTVVRQNVLILQTATEPTAIPTSGP